MQQTRRELAGAVCARMRGVREWAVSSWSGKHEMDFCKICSSSPFSSHSSSPLIPAPFPLRTHTPSHRQNRISAHVISLCCSQLFQPSTLNGNCFLPPSSYNGSPENGGSVSVTSELPGMRSCLWELEVWEENLGERSTFCMVAGFPPLT